MPESTPGAPETSRTAGRARRGLTALRLTVGAIIVVTAMAVPQIAAPTSVDAASCTGWGSISTPPPSIRVLRTGSGAVETVDFRRYVAEVMASGEWPSRLRKATLEAGAVATKQYAWYYTLKGNHRPDYVRNGKCYDVRDDVIDQLYRPVRAKPTDKQQRAINRTWGLTLRKNGTFFLTGYRAGTRSQCAADANGWKLYARSVEACAAKGWDRRRIQVRYLSPGLGFVWSNRLGPVLKNPVILLRPGNTMAGGAATITWHPASATADVSQYRVQRRSGSGEWKEIALLSPTTTKADVWLKLGTTNRFRVMAKDAKGRPGPWAYSPSRRAAVRGPVGVSLASTGTEPAMLRPDGVRVTFTGRSAALVSRTGPKMGQVKIFVNGKRVATVDLQRSTVTERALVWARNFGKHEERTIAVRAVATDDNVDFDGLYILR